MVLQHIGEAAHLLQQLAIGEATGIIVGVVALPGTMAKKENDHEETHWIIYSVLLL